MRSGSSCVTENGLTWSLEAANSISDTVAMLRPARLPSCQPHFTRELPASMARIMRPSPTPRGRCAPRARRARQQPQRAVVGQAAGDAGHHAAVGEAHAQALPGVRVHRFPFGAQRVEPAASNASSAASSAQPMPAMTPFARHAMNCSRHATSRRSLARELGVRRQLMPMPITASVPRAAGARLDQDAAELARRRPPGRSAISARRCARRARAARAPTATPATSDERGELARRPAHAPAEREGERRRRARCASAGRAGRGRRSAPRRRAAPVRRVRSSSSKSLVELQRSTTRTSTPGSDDRRRHRACPWR